MRALIDHLAAQNEAHLPLDRVTVPSWLDVGAVVSRSGESVLSFLAIAEISREKQQLSVAYETRVYDMEDGKRLSLSDFIQEDAYAYIAGEIRSQLTAAFPGVEPDAEALEALLSEESIRSAPGGQYSPYIRWEIGYPLIQWSLASGDSGNEHYDQIADRVIKHARDGAVILLHDINPGSPVYTEEILRSLAERGILCVTLEELFSDACVALQETVAYKNPYILAE